MQNVAINMCEKFHYDPFRNNRALCPIHTADADATKLFCRVGVGGVNTIRN